MTARQKIDTAKEARMWLGQVIIPLLGLAAGYVAVFPDKAKALKDKVFKKERSK